MSDTEIIPDLWMGPAPTPLKAAARGYDVIALAAKEVQPPQTDYRATLYRVPLDDTLEPSTEELMWAFLAGRRVADAVANGKKALVSCHMGINRSGLVTALAARELLGLTGEEAATLVRRQRPGSLRNPAFVSLLRSLPRAP